MRRIQHGDASEPAFADAVRALVSRVGGDARTVRVEGLEPGEGAEGAATSAEGILVVRGSDAVSASSAFARYLTEVAGRRITWEAPDIRPALDRWPDGAVTIATGFTMRYHFNVVTHGYSTAYWDWPRWERELDWMALHGVTHPLVLTAYETVLVETLRRLGLPEADGWAWVGSAAHIPWLSMGCLHSFGGPLPASWAQKRMALAQQILARAAELQMTPVLPLPGGHVPASLAGPQAREITWQGWSTPVLAPTSESYRALVSTFLAVQTELLGEPVPNPVYALDAYIESLPPQDDPVSLAAAGRGFCEALTAVVPDATWLLQGWPFHYHKEFWTAERVAAFLSQVPHDRLLLIDLWGEHAPMWRDGGTHGRRWIWTAVHNFGGRFALMGDLRGMARDIDELRTVSPAGLEGVGLAPEAVENNTVFYELATDLTWGVESISRWLDSFAEQRYGTDDVRVREVWRLLAATLYAPGRTRSIPSPVHARPWAATAPFASQRLAGEPLPEPQRISANIDAENDPRVFADLPDIARAARLLVQLEAPNRDAQERDLVELVGHLLAQGSRHHIRAILGCSAAGDADGLRAAADALTRDLLDLEALCATRPESRLETWVGSARAWADTEDEADVLERDARSLVSVWGEQHTGLHDYSARHWAGMVEDLHLARWQAWAAWLADAASAGGEPDETVLRSRIVAIEEAWRSSTALPGRSNEGTRALAARILDRVAAEPV